MKKIIRKYTPVCIKDIRNWFVYNQVICNFYKTNHMKTALLSYVTVAFGKDSFAHTSFYEAQSWARVLSELDYNVDIIDYRFIKKIDLSKYELICGFGDVFQQYFECAESHNTITIYYGAGMHVCHQNLASLTRVKDVFSRKKVWLGTSARFVEKTWTHQTTLVSGIVALGNELCADSYRKYYDGMVVPIPAPFYKTLQISEVMNTRTSKSKKHFLWFGSSGLIHKGLDLLLDYFSTHTDFTLHICGPIENEPSFVEVYKKELYEIPNIITHGFVDIKSNAFRDILWECSFVIYPSCSEGGSPSVVTAIGNGALIPIISKETTFSTGFEIWIDSLDYSGINNAINKALKLKYDEILELQRKNYEFVNLNHSQKNYYLQLKKSIKSILG